MDDLIEKSFKRVESSRVFVVSEGEIRLLDGVEKKVSEGMNV